MGTPDEEDFGQDIPITRHDINALMDEMARLYTTDEQARNILDRIDFPPPQRPNMVGSSPAVYWSAVFADLGRGIVDAPYRGLIENARRVYRSNLVLRGLARTYGPGDPGAVNTPPSPQPRPPAEQPAQVAPRPVQPTGAPPCDTGCHVIVRANTEDERRAAAAELTGRGLRPREVWSTAYAVSYRVGPDRPDQVRESLAGLGFGWTVVPPGEPDYLLAYLFVEGPDGRKFKLNDAPAQQKVGDVAAEIVDQYGTGFADATRTTVVDQIQPGGQGRRLDPDASLHEAGLRDGDHMRVAFETTAGAVNPLDRQDAIYRVRNQIVAYAESHPGFLVRADSARLPTEFEVEFERDSFAPSTVPGGGPSVIRDHLVRITLGPDFPERAPEVHWLTSVFHPNVLPNYEWGMDPRHRASAGLVCLGMLQESYQSSMNFGDLCQMLVDMAGFRNYGLYEPTGEANPDGSPKVRVNFYDRRAAEWVADNQDRIAQIGGSVARGRDRGEDRYPNVIVPVQQ